MGCYPSYYPRNHVVTRAFARILTELGVTWGVLGAKERALGECDRMFGEEGLFETLVEQNQKLLDGIEFDKIVVTRPARLPRLEELSIPASAPGIPSSTTRRSSPSGWSSSSR